MNIQEKVVVTVFGGKSEHWGTLEKTLKHWNEKGYILSSIENQTLDVLQEDDYSIKTFYEYYYEDIINIFFKEIEEELENEFTEKEMYKLYEEVVDSVFIDYTENCILSKYGKYVMDYDTKSFISEVRKNR